MAANGKPCFWWFWRPGGCLLLTVIACLAWSPAEARRRRIFDECTDAAVEKSEEKADLVITAIVERVLQSGAQVSARVKRVLKGPRELNGSVVLIEGLDGEDLCGGKLREGDTRLFLLGQGASEARTTILASPLRITLPNLDRVEAAVSHQHYRRRLHEKDLPCEAKYCPWNGDCSEDRLGIAHCSCPESCPYGQPSGGPVCGLDDNTYSSRCNLRVESCRHKKKLWARHQGACQRQPLFFSRGLSR